MICAPPPPPSTRVLAFLSNHPNTTGSLRTRNARELKCCCCWLPLLPPREERVLSSFLIKIDQSHSPCRSVSFSFVLPPSARRDPPHLGGPLGFPLSGFFQTLVRCLSLLLYLAVGIDKRLTGEALAHTHHPPPPPSSCSGGG